MRMRRRRESLLLLRETEWNANVCQVRRKNKNTV